MSEISLPHEIYLKPCPFCGETDLALCQLALGPFYINCNYCSAQGAFVETEEGACVEWNKRVYQERLMSFRDEQH